MTGREDVEAPLASRDSEFIEKCQLAYIVPFAAEPNLEQVLKPGCGGSRRSPFKAIEQREWLFFDECVDVYLILRASHRRGGGGEDEQGGSRGEKALRAQLARVSLSLEAHITNSHAVGRDTPPTTELVYSNGAVEDGREPDLLLDERFGLVGDEKGDTAGSASSKERVAFAVWKVPVFVARPRQRLQSPAVVFTASAHLRASAAADYDDEDDDEGEDGQEDDGGLRYPGHLLRGGYLPSRVPSGLNLLEAFGRDPALGGVQPQLSAQRVSRVAPVTQPRDQLRPIRSQQSLALKVFPAVHTRVKFARPNAVPASSAVIAMLEIDFTPYFDCEAILTKISLDVAGGGIVTDLGGVAAAEDSGFALPLHCVAHDHVTFLYRLAPPTHEVDAVNGATGAAAASAAGSGAAPGLQQVPSHHLQRPSTTRDLNIAIDVTALLRPGVCAPKLTMAWTTALDFTPPVNPGFGSSALTPPMQRSHRPSQLSIDGAASLIAPAVSRPDSLPSLDAAAARSIETGLPDFGVTITFSAPEHPVHAGDEFCWSVFVVNRALSVAAAAAAASASDPSPSPGIGPLGVPPIVGAARKLSLRVIPKRRRNEVRVARPPSARPAPQTRFGQHQSSTSNSKPSSQQPKPLRSAGEEDDGNDGDGDGDDDTNDPRLVADAVLDENIVHAMQRGSLVDNPDLVSLTPEARVGPLAPGACHVVELRFLALRDGIASVEAVRVVDLSSQEHVDIRELPVVVVESRPT